MADDGDWQHTGQCKSKKRGDEWGENTRCISEEHRKKRLDECE